MEEFGPFEGAFVPRIDACACVIINLDLTEFAGPGGAINSPKMGR